MYRPRLIALLAAASAGVIAYRRTLRRHDLDYFYAGKVVLVTGATHGLGLGIARELLAQSATVVICGRDRATLEHARLQLMEAGEAELLALPCDVRDPDEVQKLVSQVIEQFGRIDVLINSAGAMKIGPLASMTDADFADAFRTHFWAHYHTCRTVLPVMQARRSGRIVNITSIGGRVAVPHMLPYSAAQFAAYGFSRGLRSEVAEDGISVTTVVADLEDAKQSAKAILDAAARRDVELARGFSLPSARPTGASVSGSLPSPVSSPPGTSRTAAIAPFPQSPPPEIS